MDKRNFPTPYLKVSKLSCRYPGAEEPVLKDVSFLIYPGQFTGLVGASGSGKTTMARVLTGQLPCQEGTILLNGREIQDLSGKKRRKARLGMQMVFQNPYASLHPLQTIGWQMEEPLRLEGKLSHAERKEKVFSMMEQVGLDPALAVRYPRALSGGQRQRVAIGCALITEPELLVADEAVSALDLSVQAQILNLFQDLRKKHDFACLFISHDPDVVHYLCDRVAVLKDGRIVEENKVERVFENPAHPYTKALLGL